MEVSTRLRICLVDDNPRLRAGLRRLLSKESDMTVVAEAGSIAEARDVMRRAVANMFVVDLGLGDESGFDLIRLLRNHDPRLPVVVLSWHSESVYRMRSLELGANAYVVKSDPPTALVATLREVCATRSATMK
ncbi:MAG: response regulator transcription factor [Rhodothermales bacterium]|nr:response regulator transcription factor [Rhodothermales bacterium]